MKKGLDDKYEVHIVDEGRIEWQTEAQVFSLAISKEKGKLANQVIFHFRIDNNIGKLLLEQEKENGIEKKELEGR